jgi:hypothetical protein
VQLSGAEHAHFLEVGRAVVTGEEAIQLQLDEPAEIGRYRPTTEAVTEELLDTIHGQ